MTKLPSLAALILILLAGLVAYVRFAPINPDDWHLDLGLRPAPLVKPSPDALATLPNGAYTDLPLSPDQAQTTLAKLDAIALATPRTRRLSGSAASGRITWESRSLIWGFPDYTTAQITTDGLTMFARQRFGSQDLGVNAARLRDWLARL